MKRKRITRKTIALTITAVAAGVLFGIWQNNDLMVSSYEFYTDKIGTGFDGYRIVHISDLHNKKFGKNQSRILNVMREQKPDIIVITGDIVDGFRTKVEVALEFVSGAVKIAPVYYVSGNHELLLSTEELSLLLDGIKTAGATILDNRATYIQRKEESLYLIGVNDGSNTDRLKNILNTLDTQGNLRILLAHRPEHIDSYSENKIDLVFSGHAHGGQVRLPFIGGLVAPEQGLFPKYTAGKYVLGETAMIISRGLGNSIIPIRVFNRPDIVVTVLKAITN
ncbi:MAG: metallophosphoesterase [Acutalibacteraceae bacterium]